MFAKTIVDSDAFIDMPVTSRLLYYDLGMRADDDGFVNSPKKIMRMIGASEDDMRILINRKFIIPFDNGVVVIKHWRIHNYIRKDTYTETPYTDQKALLEVDENKAYKIRDSRTCDSPVDDPSTQVRIGKDSIGKDNISVSKDTDCRTEVLRVTEEWNTLTAYGIPSISKMSPDSERYKMLRKRISDYGVDEVLKAIDNVRHSSFLQGKAGRKPFNLTFDWFVRPNNFIKIYDGNFNDRQTQTAETYEEDWQC